MEITATAATPAQAPIPPIQDNAAAGAPATSAAPAPTDTVTLSPAAQSAPTAAALAWTSDAVTQALAALNDTSGKTSLDDQLSAYKTLAALVTDAKNFDPTKADNAKATDVATAFATSAYVQHYQDLTAQLWAFNNTMSADRWGKDLSDANQRQLDWFNSLSGTDQRTLIETHDTSTAAAGDGRMFGSIDQYKTRKQASIDVQRAIEALVSSSDYTATISANHGAIQNASVDSITATIDVITRKATADGDTQTLDLMKLYRRSDYDVAAVQAYFAKYGPAPEETDAEKAVDAAAPLPPTGYTAPTAGDMRSFFRNIATLADTSNTASATELVNAYKRVTSQTAKSISTDNGGVVWLAGVTVGYNAPGSQAIQQAETTWTSRWNMQSDTRVSIAQSYYSSYEKLDDVDQQLVAAMQGDAWDATVNNGTPDKMRGQLVDVLTISAEADAIHALYQAENDGHLTAGSTVTILGVKLNLNAIMASNDKHLDPYTRMSSDVKALLHDAAAKWAAGEKVAIDATKPAAAPPTDAEKALAALKAYAAGTAPQTDDDKALAALKANPAVPDAALTMLKNATAAGDDKPDKKGSADETNDTPHIAAGAIKPSAFDLHA